jgi:hypothetical protein
VSPISKLDKGVARSCAPGAALDWLDVEASDSIGAQELYQVGEKKRVVKTLGQRHIARVKARIQFMSLSLPGGPILAPTLK